MRKFYTFKDFTRYHEKKNKVPLSSAYQVDSGDIVCFWDEDFSMSVNAEVLSRNSWDEEIIVKSLEKHAWQQMRLDPTKYTTYVWSYAEINAYKSCECGARHTSFPDKHMFYCKLWTPD